MRSSSRSSADSFANSESHAANTSSAMTLLKRLSDIVNHP